jgi:hypothetical protein
MGVLRDYFDDNPGRNMRKWDGYFEVYERHLERFRGQAVNVMEIGVSHGGSLQMWKTYFGPQARIFGVDIVPQSKLLEEDRVAIYIGDQRDRTFLERLRAEVPRLDVLIDDGGHRMAEQIATFEVLFPHVADDGVYVCEDVHTSYWEKWDGGLRRPGTFVEYAKGLVDQLSAWHTADPASYRVDEFTRTAHSMHFYNSMIVIEKRRMQPPRKLESGKLVVVVPRETTTSGSAP